MLHTFEYGVFYNWVQISEVPNGLAARIGNCYVYAGRKDFTKPEQVQEGSVIETKGRPLLVKRNGVGHTLFFDLGPPVGYRESNKYVGLTGHLAISCIKSLEPCPNRNRTRSKGGLCLDCQTELVDNLPRTNLGDPYIHPPTGMTYILDNCADGWRLHAQGTMTNCGILSIADDMEVALHSREPWLRGFWFFVSTKNGELKVERKDGGLYV